jgi:hypothetical protein
MTLNFYDENEGIEREESINNYKELFTDLVQKPPTLEESLFHILNCSGLSNDKAEEYTKQLKADSEKQAHDNWEKINEKYPSLKFDEAAIIASYTCEAIDRKYSPYKILNRNLVSKNRKEGLSKVYKYFFLLLRTLRLLPRFYLDSSKDILYRCIDVKVNLKIDPEDESVVPYIRGKNKTFWTFTSTSPKKKVSFDFLGDNVSVGKNFKVGTIFLISGKVWGYDITVFNTYGEEEILLEPERKYYIEYHVPEVNDIISVICQIKDTPIVLEDITKKNDFFFHEGVGKTIKLICKLGTKDIKIIYVHIDDTISILIHKLQLKDFGSTKFEFKGVTYSIISIETFEEIGLTNDYRINFINPAIVG